MSKQSEQSQQYTNLILNFLFSVPQTIQNHHQISYNKFRDSLKASIKNIKQEKNNNQSQLSDASEPQKVSNTLINLQHPQNQDLKQKKNEYISSSDVEGIQNKPFQHLQNQEYQNSKPPVSRLLDFFKQTPVVVINKYKHFSEDFKQKWKAHVETKNNKVPQQNNDQNAIIQIHNTLLDQGKTKLNQHEGQKNFLPHGQLKTYIKEKDESKTLQENLLQKGQTQSNNKMSNVGGSVDLEEEQNKLRQKSNQNYDRLRQMNDQKRQLEEMLKNIEKEINGLEHSDTKHDNTSNQDYEGEDGENNRATIQQINSSRNNNSQSVHQYNNSDTRVGQQYQGKGKFSHYQRIAEDREASVKALEFIRKMTNERKEMEKRKNAERAQLTRQILYSIEESKQISLQQQRKILNEKRDKIIQRLEASKQRQQQRLMLDQQSNNIIRQLKQENRQDQPEQRYYQEIELPELERRKQELAEKRKLYKPINSEDFRSHQVKHDDDLRLVRKEKLMKEFNDNAFNDRPSQSRTGGGGAGSGLEDIGSRDKDRRQQLIQDDLDNEFMFEYLQNKPMKSIFTKKVVEQDREIKYKDQIIFQEKKELMDRRRKYAQLVKDVFIPAQMPNISPGVATNANDPNQAIGNSFENTPQKLEKQKVLKRKKELYDKYSNYKQYQNSVNVVKGPGFSSNNNIFRGNVGGGSGDNGEYDFAPNDEGLNQEHSNPSAHSMKHRIVQKQKVFKSIVDEIRPIQTVTKKPNYLQILRREREEYEKKYGMRSQQDNWEKYNNDESLSHNEKFNYIMQTAQKIEHKAKMKEMSQKYDPTVQEKVNSMYIDSIKAKLALLDNMKQ